MYELPRRVDGGVVNQGPVFNGDSARRWADVQYSYQYPYQWNYRPVPLNRVVVTEPTNSNGDNANVTTQNVVSNHSNFNYLTPKQVTDKINRPRETNNTSVNNTKTKQFDVNTSNISDNNKVRNEPNDTVNRFNNENVTKVPRYGTKTTQDNEVTPKIELKAEKGEEDDRWVWSNADDKIVETTTLVDLDDRAAFSADGCPVGKVKVGDKCITRA
uniref:Uncharacterized protein n=1 Tax=Heliothis virescens TaxID=7102 RepID=A0A2A4ITC9_HELVI